LTSDNKNKLLGKKGLLGLFLSVLLAIVFLYFAFKGIDTGLMIGYFSNVSLPYITLFLFLTFFAHYIRAIRWKIFLKPFKQEIKTSYCFSSLIIGYGFNNVIPRSGEIIRPLALGNLEGISRSSIFGTIVVERIIDIIFLGLAVIFSVVIYKGDIYGYFPWLKTTVYIGTGIILSAILFILLLIRYRNRFYNHLVKFLQTISPKYAVSLASFLDKIIDGFNTLSGWKNYFNVFVLSILIIGFYALTSYVGLFIFDLRDNTIHINFFTGWIIMSISSIGILIPTPGGIGSYHTITKSTLVALYGFSPEVSIAYATLTHGLSFFAHIIFSGFYMLIYKNKVAIFNFRSLNN